MLGSEWMVGPRVVGTSLSLSSVQSGDADGRLDVMNCIYQLEISSFMFSLGGTFS